MSATEEKKVRYVCDICPRQGTDHRIGVEMGNCTNLFAAKLREVGEYLIK